MKIAFVDRDGTLIWEPEDTKQIDSVEKLRLLPNAVEGLRRLRDAGFTLVMVTNQDGLGTPKFPLAGFEAAQSQLLSLLGAEGIFFMEVFVCPHTLADGCDCRKPKTGLVRDFLALHAPSNESLMIGDRDTDGEFANNIGVSFVKMLTNGEFPL